MPRKMQFLTGNHEINTKNWNVFRKKKLCLFANVETVKLKKVSRVPSEKKGKVDILEACLSHAEQKSFGLGFARKG